jgi:chromosomal replication initiator protein
MNSNQIWQAALGELQGAMTPATFETWVKNTVVVGQRGTTFTIGAPNTFAKEWLDTRFRGQIEMTLGRIMGRPAAIEVVVEGMRPSAADDGLWVLGGGDAPSENAAPASERSRRAGGGATSAKRRKLTDADAPAPALVPQHPTPNTQHPTRYQDDRWTFSTFIVGPSNRFAYAAAEAVAAEPGTTYNPLFIHGGVGLGKTHLLHAIAQASEALGLRVLYVTCEQFTNDIIDAIQRRTTDAFRAAYRENDVLLIDDIQFLAGKESTQEEFFHTFNHLHGARRQIVISSDRPPRAIATLEQRLTSRFEWGLIADIQPPDFETRQAILRARAAELPHAPPLEVLELLAQRVQRNVRELEGSLTTVTAYARLNDLPLTVETASKALSDVTKARGRQVQPAEVVAAVAQHFGVDAKLLRGKQRDREIVVPRQIAMYLMREETTASLLEIGRELGGRDHSTVLHGWEKIKGEVDVDDRLRKAVLALREKLLAGGY